MKKYLVFISIGFELIGAILLGIYFAEKLEEKFQSKGFITLGIMFVILAGWFVHITYLLKNINKKDNDGP